MKTAQESFQELTLERMPVWGRIALVVVAILMTIEASRMRGIVGGLVAALVYGSMALRSVLDRGRPATWGRRHPVLDSLFFIPLLFLALAYVTDLSSGLCLLIAVAAGIPSAGRAAARRRGGRV